VAEKVVKAMKELKIPVPPEAYIPVTGGRYLNAAATTLQTATKGGSGGGFGAGGGFGGGGAGAR